MRRELLSCPENTRPAVRVINVPPPYKVLNFRSVRKRNISRNTGTAATGNVAVYQAGGENYSTDQDVNIGELYRWHAEAHIVLTKGWTIELYRGFCKNTIFEKVNSLSLELCPFPGYCKSSGFELSVRRLTRSSFNFLPSSSSIFIGDYWIEIIRTIVSLYQASRESFILSSESEFLIIFRKRSRSFVLKNRIGSGTSHRWN